MSTEETQTETQGLDGAQMIGLLQVKLDAANAQILHLGLLIEYLYKELDEKKIGLDLESYPTWAQNRFKEIQSMSDSEEGEKIKNEMQSEMEEIAKNINLT